MTSRWLHFEVISLLVFAVCCCLYRRRRHRKYRHYAFAAQPIYTYHTHTRDMPSPIFKIYNTMPAYYYSHFIIELSSYYIYV